jgi:hypothetical protein
MGLNCSTAGVKDAFEGSSFDRAAPTPAMFDAWYQRNMRHVLDAINAPVLDLRAKVVAALSNTDSILVPDDGVALEKETSLRRQICESRGGSRLFCQKLHPLPWDASSAMLESRLSCPANSSFSIDHFGVPISTQEASVLYLPLIDDELDDVMLIANMTRVLLPVFQNNYKKSKTVRFQRFVAADGVALIFPAVSARHVKPTYTSTSNLNDLRESPSFTHSSCARQVVFVLDVSSKNMHFDIQHRSEALIFRIFRLLNQYDHVQLILSSSGSSKMVLESATGFVAADAITYSALQTQLGQVARSGQLFLDSGISLAQDLLRAAPSQHPSCLKKFLIVVSSDEASLLPNTINRHISLGESRDAAGSSQQPHFIFFSMDSGGRSRLAEKFCEKKMIYRSIPRMDSKIYKGLDEIRDTNDFFATDASFAVMRYCTFLFELLIVNGVGPGSADDMNKVVWSPPFYDPAAAPGSLIFTTSAPVYVISFLLQCLFVTLWTATPAARERFVSVAL